MELPAGYRLRAPAPGDLHAVAEVLIADELGEAGRVVLGTDFVRDEWSRVGSIWPPMPGWWPTMRG